MLVNTYSKRIFNIAYQFSGSFEEAEDLTQDIFFKLYNTLSRFDFKKNFSAWLLTMARNYLIDQYRKTKWEKKARDNFDDHFLPSDSADNPEEGMVKAESKRMIWQSMSSLAPDIRMAVILRDIQGRSYEEMAEIMNVPLGTVKSRVNRARLQLARVFKEKKEKDNEL